MPTVMTHALVAGGLGVLYARRRMPALFWIATAGLAMLPDLDVWAFRLGIPYGDPFGHRGFSHSLAFAAAAGAGGAWLVRQRDAAAGRFLDLWGYLFAVTASHGFLDAFTDGGMGVAFFWPLDNTRYFFPWHPVRVSPIGLSFFSADGWATLRSEIVAIWLPTLAAVALVLLYRRWRRRAQAA